MMRMPVISNAWKVTSYLSLFLILGAVVFYYLVYIPFLGGYSVAVQTSELKETYLPGEEVVLQGILSNTSKNASDFEVSFAIGNGYDVSKKTFYLLAGELQRFSFNYVLPKTHGLHVAELRVKRGVPLFKKDSMLYADARVLNITSPPPKPVSVVAKIPPPVPKKIVEEKKVFDFVTAEFSAAFAARARYNQRYDVPVTIKNTTPTQERFSIILNVLKPSGEEKTLSEDIVLKPGEEKQMRVSYDISDRLLEGNYRLKSWYTSRQGKSEEMESGEFVLRDEMPSLKIKKMLLSPVHGEVSEILVEASDDKGVDSVVFNAAIRRGNRRSEWVNIPMYLYKGDYRDGVWRCEYKPEKADAYFFSFGALDTKRQKIKLGEFAINVIK